MSASSDAGPGRAESGKGKSPLDIETAAAGAYGELMRRVAHSVLSFTFKWRGTSFRGTFEGHDDRLRLSLASDLASIPYSAEDPRLRNNLLAIVDACRDERAGNLRIVEGQGIMLESKINLSTDTLDTVSGIVATLTILVLRTAPFLDLIAERASTCRALTAAQVKGA